MVLRSELHVVEYEGFGKPFRLYSDNATSSLLHQPELVLPATPLPDFELVLELETPKANGDGVWRSRYCVGE